MEKKPANENAADMDENASAADSGTQTDAAEANVPDPKPDPEIAQGRRKTIVRLMDAMRESEQGPISSRIVHETLLALAISVFVRTIGREGAALLIERLPEKIRNGEFGDADPPKS